jgi:hypothetical protein
LKCAEIKTQPQRKKIDCQKKSKFKERADGKKCTRNINEAMQLQKYRAKKEMHLENKGSNIKKKPQQVIEQRK